MKYAKNETEKAQSVQLWALWRSGWDSNPRALADNLISRGIVNKTPLHLFVFCSVLALEQASLTKEIVFPHAGDVLRFLSAILASGTIRAPSIASCRYGITGVAPRLNRRYSAFIQRICIDIAYHMKYNKEKGGSDMASINMSIRTDSELKAQAEQILSQLGMNMTGTINMFLQQIVRDRAVPLSLSLSSEQSLYADLLRAKVERDSGAEYLSADEFLTRMDRAIEGAGENG